MDCQSVGAHCRLKHVIHNFEFIQNRLFVHSAILWAVFTFSQFLISIIFCSQDSTICLSRRFLRCGTWSWRVRTTVTSRTWRRLTARTRDTRCKPRGTNLWTTTHRFLGKVAVQPPVVSNLCMTKLHIFRDVYPSVLEQYTTKNRNGFPQKAWKGWKSCFQTFFLLDKSFSRVNKNLNSFWRKLMSGKLVSSQFALFPNKILWGV